jgi:phosphoribosylaminoimidazole-succinocarboxamide synthase
MEMNKKLHVKIQELGQPDYIGSVQRLYYLKGSPRLMVCETTSGGSVFDVGTIFLIPNSDICRAALRHRIYTQLSSKDEWDRIIREIKRTRRIAERIIPFAGDEILNRFESEGALTHHVGMVDNETGIVYKREFPPTLSRYVVVKRYQIVKPKQVYYLDNALRDYSIFNNSNKFVIPLENIVRFGVTPGSSVFKKYLSLNGAEKKKYLREMNLIGDMKPWGKFLYPRMDFTTKHEPEDRNLSLQEALYISGCDGEHFLDIIRISLLASFMVSNFFGMLKLFLWDLKWEIAKDGDDLVFVDTIDTDSIRVTMPIEYKSNHYQVHFNKQAMRDYYKIMHPKWFKSLNIAKAKARRSGKAFHEYFRDGQDRGIYPVTPDVDTVFVQIQESKFLAFLQYLTGKSDAAGTGKELKNIAFEEVNYYHKLKKFNAFSSFNKID